MWRSSVPGFQGSLGLSQAEREKFDRRKDQGFETGYRARAQVEDRLIVQLELPIDDGGTQVELQVSTQLQLPVHLALEKPMSAAPVCLGQVECHVRILEKLIRVGAIAGRDRNADAGPDHDVFAVDVERSAQGINYAARQLTAVLRPINTALNDGKLV